MNSAAIRKYRFEKHFTHLFGSTLAYNSTVEGRDGKTKRSIFETEKCFSPIDPYSIKKAVSAANITEGDGTVDQNSIDLSIDPFTRICTLSSDPKDLAEFERSLDKQMAEKSPYKLIERDYAAEARLIERINKCCSSQSES